MLTTLLKTVLYPKDSPVITVPSLQTVKNYTLNKDFKGNIDEDFKTRSSQLTNAHFKDMPCLIKVSKSDLTTHFIPGFTETPNDLHSRNRHFEQVSKKNEFVFVPKTQIKANKINPEKVVKNVTPKNKYNDVTLESNRHRVIPTPIVPIVQTKKKLLIKH